MHIFVVERAEVLRIEGVLHPGHHPVDAVSFPETVGGLLQQTFLTKSFTKAEKRNVKFNVDIKELCWLSLLQTNMSVNVLMCFLKIGSFYGGCGLNTRLQKVKNKFDFIDSKLCLFYSKFPGCLELVLYAGHLWGQVLLDRCRKKILLFQRKQILVAYFLNTLCLGHSSQAWMSYYLTSRAPTTLLLCP